MKVEIRNKSWYDQKAKQLNSLTKNLRSFDPEKLHSDNLDEMRKIDWNLMIYGECACRIDKIFKDHIRIKALNLNSYLPMYVKMSDFVPVPMNKPKSFTIGEYIYGE